MRIPVHRWLWLLGCLAWIAGYFALGGTDDRAGALVIFLGAILVLTSLAIEIALAGKRRRRGR